MHTLDSWVSLENLDQCVAVGVLWSYISLAQTPEPKDIATLNPEGCSYIQEP